MLLEPGQGSGPGVPRRLLPLQRNLRFHHPIVSGVVQAEAEFLTDALHGEIIREDLGSDALELLVAANPEEPAQ